MNIPESEHTLKNVIDMIPPPDDRRAHLGAALLGHHCERYMWLNFRWALPQIADRRLLRIFDHGRQIEKSTVKLIKKAGCRVKYTGRGQRFLDLAPHIGGSPDGVIVSGLPESPKTPHVMEIKSANDSNFNATKKSGLVKNHWQHYVQLQIYMHGLKMSRGIYIVVNKNTDEIYTERVYADSECVKKYLDRGSRIVFFEHAPDRISTDQSWYQCKICPAHAMCHLSQPTAEINCRTCAHSTPMATGGWYCERHQGTGNTIEKGCPAHTLHPDLVPWPQTAHPSSQWLAVYEINGVKYPNGEGEFSSAEILKIGKESNSHGN